MGIVSFVFWCILLSRKNALFYYSRLRVCLSVRKSVQQKIIFRKRFFRYLFLKNIIAYIFFGKCFFFTEIFVDENFFSMNFYFKFFIPNFFSENLFFFKFSCGNFCGIFFVLYCEDFLIPKNFIFTKIFCIL